MSLPARDPVAGFFDFGEKGGIAVPGADVFAPFTGYSMGPGATAATIPLGGGLGDAAAVYRKSNMWGFDQDNGPIVKQYVSAHKSIPVLKEDTGASHILYASNPRWRKHLEAKEIGKARRDDPVFHGVTEPLEFKSLPRLNRWLRTKEGRMLFGKDQDCARLRATFKFAGVQITKPHDELGATDEFVLAITIGRRARTKDFTVIDGKGAQINDVVFVVWRRYKYTGVTLPTGKAAVPASLPRNFQSIIRRRAGIDADELEDSDIELEPEEETKEEKKKAVGPRVAAKALQKPGTAADQKEDEYYWQGDIWYGPRGRRPNEALYLPDNGSFIGGTDFLGYVLDLYGDRSQVMVNQANAREALHPTNDSDDWKKAYVALPDIEIHLNVR